MTAIANRNSAFYGIENLGERQYKVLEAIRLNQPCTSQEIAKFLGLAINQVTGRISELRDEYVMIQEAGQKWNALSNTPNTTWKMYASEADRRHAIENKYIELVEIKEQLESDGHEKVSPYVAGIIAREIEKVNKKIEKVTKL